MDQNKNRETLPHAIWMSPFTWKHLFRCFCALSTVRMLRTQNLSHFSWLECCIHDIQIIHRHRDAVPSTMSVAGVSHGTYENLCNAFGNSNFRDRKIEANKRGNVPLGVYVWNVLMCHFSHIIPNNDARKALWIVLTYENNQFSRYHIHHKNSRSQPDQLVNQSSLSGAKYHWSIKISDEHVSNTSSLVIWQRNERDGTILDIFRSQWSAFGNLFPSIFRSVYTQYTCGIHMARYSHTKMGIWKWSKYTPPKHGKIKPKT